MALGRFAQATIRGNVGFNVFDALFGSITGKYQRYDPSGISMAAIRDRAGGKVITSAGLLALADAAAKQAQAKISGQSSGTNQTPIPQPVSSTFAAVGEQKLEPLVQSRNQNMGLDLGNLLGNLGSQYISARWGTPRAPQVMAPTIQAQGPVAGIAATPVVGPLVAGGLGALAGEAYDFFTEDQRAQLPVAPGGVNITGNCPPPSYCVDGKTGKVTIKQKRRRRRRLATSSDIRDLSSLKSVLSPADLKMWIATHPS